MSAMPPIAEGSIPAPKSVAEVVDLVSRMPKVLAVGAGTKPVPSFCPEGCAPIAMRGLSGIVEYDPGELTFTALAGTPLGEIAAALARHGQHLPFDPPFARDGATLGGTIAAGLSGAGRQRYGGVRDFILGIRFVSGLGEQVRGGGKVVKNAAGFDLPKLFVGSLGRLGILVEATFKVFPRPKAFATLRFDCGSVSEAIQLIESLKAGSFDFEAVEILPDDSAVAVRLGGPPESFLARLGAAERAAGRAASRLLEEADAAFWRNLEPARPAGADAILAKVPLTTAEIPAFDKDLAAAGARRRYSSGGNVAWVEWSLGFNAFESLLREHGLSGLALAGPAPRPLIGSFRSEPFRSRVKAALDPKNRFPGF
jgi:glycolate oxidase FAD binding subunit